MHELITCFCGRSLGDLSAAFAAMRKKVRDEYLKKHNININPNNFGVNDDTKVDLSGVFKALKIKAPCCKSHMSTQLNFHDYYD